MKTIVWFRQDLRLQDNPALYHALTLGEVIPIYIFEEEACIKWPLGGASKWWLHHSLESLQASLKKFRLPLYVFKGNVEAILNDVVVKTNAQHIMWNRCYEPAAIARDKHLKQQFKANGIDVSSYNANLLFEPWEIENKSGGFFKVFTPFWKHCLQQTPLPMLETAPLLNSIQSVESYALDVVRISDLNLLPQAPNWAKGFELLWNPGEAGALKAFETFLDDAVFDYKEKRDFMNLNATSRLSPHLHFGEISPRQIFESCNRLLSQHANNSVGIGCFLSELGWREFAYHLLYHVPHLPEQPFKSEFEGFPWSKDLDNLQKWQQGKTGVPIVDAAMRELWKTGYMHNRARMIVASFLTKNLRIHWLSGAEWFWDTLLDADLANNSASWQWVAGCGADAAPYFRVFNPVLQGQKFDPDGEYVKHWVPELKSLDPKYIHQPWEASHVDLDKAGIVLGVNYPKPIVDLKQTREEALAAYETIKKANAPEC